MDWESFKKTEFAVRCEIEKTAFLADCEAHGIITANLSDHAVNARNLFVSRLCYADQFSGGRYELMTVEEWQTKPKMLFEGIKITPYKRR